MTRLKLSAYIIDFIGVLLIAYYAIGHFIKESHARQMSDGFKPKISVEEGSFWLTTNTDPFFLPGVILLIIGMALMIHDTKKTMDLKSGEQEVRPKP